MATTSEEVEKLTKKTGHDDTQFTLALMDKYQLSDFHETLRDDDADASFTLVKPFLRQSLRYCRDNVDIIPGSTNGTDSYNYYVVTKQTRRKIPMSERITNFFTETPNDETSDNSLSYYASVILFPLKDSPNLALVYLLGHWKSLINRECIVINFGLRITASEGMAQVGEEGKMNCIKSAGTVTTRGGISTKNWSKNRASLGKLSDLKCIRDDSVLTEIRAKPNPTFGRKLISGKDGITIHETLPTDIMEKAKYASRLRENAFRRYRIFLEGPLVKEISIYFDSPVRPQIAQELYRKLDENWATFIENKVIAYHEVLWSMLLSEPSRDKTYVDETLELLNAGTSGTIIRVGRDRTRIANLITVQCIYLDNPGTQEKSYYRMERGTWYEMDHCKLKLFKANILEHHLIDRDDINLPAAYEGKEEREEQYNARAVDEINAQDTGKFSATLLDKKMVFLKKPNSFELADLFLRDKSNTRSPCYLVHVKKAAVNDLDHLCNQVRRSAHYLTRNLDRTPVAKCITKCMQTEMYSKYIDLPANKKMFAHFQKQITCPRTREDLMDMLNSYVTAKGRKSRVNEVLKIKEIIGQCNEWKDMFENLSKYDLALNRWLDCVVDFVASPKNGAIPTADVMKEFLELMLEWLSKYDIFTEHTHGLLLPRYKSSITFVLAIIGNRAPEDYMIDNKVVLLDNVIREVEGDGFQCKVTFIPHIDKMGTEKPPETAERSASVAGYQKTLQKNKKSKLLTVKENSANNFTKDVVGVGKNVGKTVKKRAPPSAKQTGKPGSNPPNVLLKKQNHSDEESK